ncbi:MAG TPA: right-handed parallel beta-helix repeat-containing protein, partial [Pseudonocardia sp.]|nr:right-handed parallel beta-helix repeat-containing protein [Pseudonocardia sp.]
MTRDDNLQRSIGSHADGTTFCLSEGVHRLESPVIPKQGDALIGRPGAVLSGSVVISGWQRDQNAWSSAGSRDPFGHVGGIRCVKGTTTCDETQDVFLDKQRLRRVERRAEVTVGTVYIDRQTNMITIGDDPRSHLLEQAVAFGLVRGDAGDVTIANLVLEEAANPAQAGAIESRKLQAGYPAGSGWRILDNEVRLNHGVGLGFADGAVVSGNIVHHQGQLGVSSTGRGSILTNNEISFNNTAGYSMEWESGGLKSWRAESTTMTHNYVHDNFGPGLWTDGGNAGMAIEYNKVADNWAGGIEYELSYDAIIGHNEITGNGRRHKGWAWDAGIEVASSGGAGRIEVCDNVLTGNANGITLIDSRGRSMERPTPYGPHTVQNVWV